MDAGKTERPGRCVRGERVVTKMLWSHSFVLDALPSIHKFYRKLFLFNLELNVILTLSDQQPVSKDLDLCLIRSTIHFFNLLSLALLAGQ